MQHCDCHGKELHAVCRSGWLEESSFERSTRSGCVQGASGISIEAFEPSGNRKIPVRAVVKNGVALLASSYILVLSACGKSGGVEMGSMSNPGQVPQEVVRIISAIDMGDMQALRDLLQSGANATPPGSPLSPIHAAITHFDKGQLICDSAALNLLLEHGADPNFIDQYSKFSPIEDALAMGDMNCAELLRDAGARLDKPGLTGQSIMGFAVKGAIRTKNLGILRHVPSWGVDPNVTAGASGQTALFDAAATPGGEFAFRELIKVGVDPCIRDSTGMLASNRAQNLARSLKGTAELHSQEFLRLCGTRY